MFVQFNELLSVLLKCMEESAFGSSLAPTCQPFPIDLIHDISEAQKIVSKIPVVFSHLFGFTTQ